MIKYCLVSISLTKVGINVIGGSELKAGSVLNVSNTVNAASAKTSIDDAIRQNHII